MRTIVYYVPDVAFSTEEKERRLAIMTSHLPAGYHIVFRSPSTGPDFVETEDDLARAMEAVADDVRTIDQDEYLAFLVGEAMDIIVPLVRPLINVPLIAPGEETLRIAAMIGAPTSVVVMHELDKQLAEQFLQRVSVKPEIVSIRSLDTPFENILANLEQTRSALKQEASRAIHEDGAAAIFLGAMTLNTLGLGEELRRELGAIVYDPLRVGLRIAAEVAFSRAGESGVSHTSV